MKRHTMSEVNVIGPETHIPIKIIIPILTALVMGSLWVNTRLNTIEARINVGIQGAWTIAGMQKWTHALKSDNPLLLVPSPYDFVSSPNNFTNDARGFVSFGVE